MYTVGQKVVHKTFGVGEVVAITEREYINGVKDASIITVKFPKFARQVEVEHYINQARSYYTYETSDEYRFTEESLNAHLVNNTPEDIEEGDVIA